MTSTPRQPNARSLLPGPRARLTISATVRRQLRAQAHHLSPSVMIGHAGLGPAVVSETDAALNAHGLMKMRVLGDDRNQREAWLRELCAQLGAAPVQHIGKLLVLWRPVPAKAKDAQSENPGPSAHKIVVNSSRGGQRPQVRRVVIAGNERITFGGKIKRADKRKVSSKKRHSNND